MQHPKTFRELLVDELHARPRLCATYVGIEEEAALGLMIYHRVHRWSDKPNDSDPTWPIQGVPNPASEHREGEYWSHAGSFVADAWILTVHQVFFEVDCKSRLRWEVTAHARQSDTDYWPTREICQSEVTEWALRLHAMMLTKVGKDCDCEGDAVTPAEHWVEAKRRYILNNNQTCCLLFAAGLDPEGRHRCNPWLPLPPHVELWLHFADLLCGLKAGVRIEDVQPDDLYASGGALDLHDALKLFKNWLQDDKWLKAVGA